MSQDTPFARSLFRSQQTALSQLMTGMDSEAPCLLLLGPEGSGLTTVLHALLTEVEDTEAHVVSCDGSDVADVDALVAQLHAQLGLPERGDGGRRRGPALAEVLESRRSAGVPLAILIDDAHMLSPGSLNALAEITRAAPPQAAVCVVLAGRPPLDRAVAAAWKRGSGRDPVTVTLGGMTPVDLQRYVEQRLGQDGPEGVVLGPGALARITRYTGGLPGLVNRLCDRVRQTPSARITDRITADAVDEAAESLGLARPEPEPRPSLAARLGTPGDEEETPGGRRRPSRWRRIAALAVIAAVVTVLVVRVGPEAARRGPAVVEASRAWLDQRGWLAAFTGEPEPEAGAPSRDERASGRPARSAPASARTRPSAPAASTAKAQSPAPPRQVAATPPARRPARPSPRQIGSLFGAAREGQLAGVTEALEAGVPVDARDPQGNTPLMHAVAHGREAVARVLLDRGARIDVADRGGLTPTMLAVIHGRRDLLQTLLARGADVNARSGTGWTPLTFAAWKGDPELVRLLLDHGAQTDIVDRQGWTPLHYAEWKAEVSRTAAAGQRDAPPGPAAPATRDAEVVPLLQDAARRRADPPRAAEARPLFRVVGE